VWQQRAVKASSARQKWLPARTILKNTDCTLAAWKQLRKIWKQSMTDWQTMQHFWICSASPHLGSHILTHLKFWSLSKTWRQHEATTCLKMSEAFPATQGAGARQSLFAKVQKIRKATLSTRFPWRPMNFRHVESCQYGYFCQARKQGRCEPLTGLV